MSNKKIVGPVIDLGQMWQSVKLEFSRNADVASFFGIIFSFLAFADSTACAAISVHHICCGRGVSLPQSWVETGQVADYVSQFTLIGFCFFLSVGAAILFSHSSKVVFRLVCPKKS